MSVRNILWVILFCGMQCAAQLLFKWGSGSKSRWLWGSVGGYVFVVSSCWILMILYKTMNVYEDYADNLCVAPAYRVE